MKPYPKCDKPEFCNTKFAPQGSQIVSSWLQRGYPSRVGLILKNVMRNNLPQVPTTKKAICKMRDNILVVRTDRIGDVVLTTPVFKALRHAFPLSRITVLVTPVTVDLVCGNPYIDEVLVDDRKGCHRGLLGLLRLARDIRRRRFDIAFILHTKRRTNLACFLAGVLARVGYKNNKLGGLLTHPAVDTRHLGLKHEAQYCVDLLGVVGIKHPPLDLMVPVQKDAENWVGQWLKDNNINPGEFIAIHPGASDTTRLWPTDSYAQLISSLAGRYALKVVLVGGQETADTAQEIVVKTPVTVLDLTGKTSIAQTASLLRRSRLLISSDSGPLHMATGVGISVICLFLRSQPGINPTRWRPLGPKSFTLTNKVGEEILLDRKGGIKSGKKDSITVPEVLAQMEVVFARENQSMFYW